MILVTIPGRGPWRLEHLLLDVNGTLTIDGTLLPGVTERIAALRAHLAMRLLSADTRGNAAHLAHRLELPLEVTNGRDEAAAKAAVARRLGAEQVVAIGNGAIDAPLLSVARVGIAVVGPEGASTATLRSADVVVTEVTDALDLLLYKTRLVATLRR
ncbi:MAG: ATPase P [Chloroflexi bacterium]|nr:ATPase P [Chloroflexota bacterium]